MKVRCIRTYKDLEFNKMMEVGKEWHTSSERAEMLAKKGLVEIEENKIEKAIKPQKRIERPTKRIK